jgi:ATP/ADP translocase
MHIAVRAAIFAIVLACAVLVEILAWGVGAAQFLKPGYLFLLFFFALVCHSFVNDLAAAFNVPAVKAYEISYLDSNIPVPTEVRLFALYPIFSAALYFMMSYPRAR